MCASIRTVRFISRPRARFTHTQKFERDPERERGHGVVYTGTQSFIITFSYSLAFGEL